MKPYVSEILEHNGKTYLLPIPAKYRELLDCAHTLGLKDEADEKDMKLIGYKTQLVPEPDICVSRYDVERTANALSKLSDTQVRAIGALCYTFMLPFEDIMGVLTHIYPHLGGSQ